MNKKITFVSVIVVVLVLLGGAIVGVVNKGEEPDFQRAYQYMVVGEYEEAILMFRLSLIRGLRLCIIK